MELDTEALIAAVEKRKALYDKTEDNYSNRVYICRQWKEIADEIGIDEQAAKKKWCTLRDYFVKQHKRMTTAKPGTAIFKKKKWYLYDSMLFLLPYLMDRKTCSNLSDDSDGDDGSTSHASDASFQAPVESYSFYQDVESQDSLPQEPVSEHESPAVADTQSWDRTKGQASNTRKRKANFPQEQAERDSLRRDIPHSLKDKGGRCTETKMDEDEDELFFRSLVPKMKRLNPLTRMECQVDIQMMVLRYLRRAALPKPTHPQPTHSQPTRPQPTHLLKEQYVYPCDKEQE